MSRQHPAAWPVIFFLVIAVILIVLFLVATIPARGEGDGERRYVAMTVSELAGKAPGDDVPTHVDIAGLVTLAKHERDGDRHLRICEDERCAAAVILECVPWHPEPCANVHKGQWVRAWGISRWDGHHKQWEIHPTERLEALP